jgi:hypothetical protein
MEENYRNAGTGAFPSNSGSKQMGPGSLAKRAEEEVTVVPVSFEAFSVGNLASIDGRKLSAPLVAAGADQFDNSQLNPSFLQHFDCHDQIHVH